MWSAREFHKYFTKHIGKKIFLLEVCWLYLTKSIIDFYISQLVRALWLVNLSDHGAVSRKLRKLFGPVKPLQNLEPCDYRAVLFTYSKDREKFPSYKKFQAYTLLRF